MQERSNIVTFPLPPSDTAASFAFAVGGESIQDTLVRVRNQYPSLITADQAAAVLNETAYLHRADGWALLGKAVCVFGGRLPRDDVLPERCWYSSINARH